MTFLDRLWHRLWAEINNPGGGEFAAEHHRATTFAGHVMIGACFAGLGYWWAGFVVAGVYYLIKEAPDMRRGGKLRDGIEDTAGVWFGTFYGPWWWPWLGLFATALIFVLAAARRVK